MKPILKWAGGKARLAEQICLAFEEGCAGTYYEPFLGSAAVYLYRYSHGTVEKAVLADANPKLMAVHIAVRDRVHDLLAELERLPSDDWRERYYDVREMYNAGPWTGPGHAARFVWLNRAGYNGLYRENRSGGFNVPVGSYVRLSIPSEERFCEVSAALANVELITSGFEDCMRSAGENDQVYCDPPYVPLSATANFTGYCKEPFGPAEQNALALAARRAAFNGARVVLSNHDLPIVRNELYAPKHGFTHVARPRVARAISRKASTRVRVGEVIARIGPLRKVG
ncbi:MAG: DNA adenine methylase [Kiritimatiellia bacterium]|jgi:DNA adenine methylase